MEITRIEHVPFMGADLIGAQDNEGNIWAGVRQICNGIGLSKGQVNNERRKIQTDYVLSKYKLHLALPTNGGMQEVLCIRIDFLQLWLAKISITPAMKMENPELAERLKQFQLKAKDVLTAAFKKPDLSPELQMLKLLIEKAANAEIEQKRQAAALESVIHKVDTLYSNPENWQEECSKTLEQVAQVVEARGLGNAYDEIDAEAYTLVDARAGVSLTTRLKNKRRRMADEGVCKSKRDKLNKLDVIADDKKLIEIYIAVCKEMAVKYGAAIKEV